MKTTVLRVSGMSCTGCEQRIATVLRRVDGVQEVSADHTTGHVEVRGSAELPDQNVLTEWVEAAGFEVTEGYSR